MAWDTLKESLLSELVQRIDNRAEPSDQQSLHNLSAALYSRFPAEDMRGRSVENLYGCLYGLLRFLRKWPDHSPKIRIFNAEIQSHGWESKYTTLAILCRGIPFSTASVRGELNRRNLRIHTIASSNLATTRDEEGNLLGVLAADGDGGSETPEEALLYFEIGRHSNPRELEELRTTLEEILGEVAVVVDDFTVMCERLQDAASAITGSECVERDFRDEAVAFLGWLDRDHMTLLGYEYLEVQHAGASTSIEVKKDTSLGLLRHRTTHGVQDLRSDLDNMSLPQLHRKQLSFSKSRVRSRVHRLTYPDYVEVRVFDDAGELIGQHRFIGLYTSTVYKPINRCWPISSPASSNTLTST